VLLTAVVINVVMPPALVPKKNVVFLLVAVLFEVAV
jgi:hypothetical protein